jgi:hypothetical protein
MWFGISNMRRDMDGLMRPTRNFLTSLGLPPRDLGELPDSEKRFPDGAQYRI